MKKAIQASLKAMAEADAARDKVQRATALAELDSLGRMDPSDGAVAVQLAEAKAEVGRQERQAAKGAAIRCRCKWLAEGERCSRYFLSLEQGRRAPPGDLAVQTADGTQVLEGRVPIAREVRKVWSEIFTEPAATPEAAKISSDVANKYLNRWRPRLSRAARAALERPITVEEGEEAVHLMRAAAAPGPDGLPASVLQLHWDLLGPLWLAMVLEGERLRSLPEAVTAGLLVLLAKSQAAVRKAAENRPITLLNADYKLLTGIMARRLNKVIGAVVGELQTGFIAGRFIGDNVILTRDYLHWLKQRNEQRAVLFLDFQKAYDRVRWEWLWQVMETVGISGSFLHLTQACYANPTVKVTLEGVALGRLHPSRGVRQGCPLSPLLFALTIEPLHYALVTDPAIHGAALPLRSDGSRAPNLKTTLFADDVTLYPGDEVDARRMLGLVKEFGMASGSALNQGKSVVVMSLPFQRRAFAGLHVVQPGEPVKSLGMLYGPDVSPEVQWASIMAKMRERCADGGSGRGCRCGAVLRWRTRWCRQWRHT